MLPGDGGVLSKRKVTVIFFSWIVCAVDGGMSGNSDVVLIPIGAISQAQPVICRKGEFMRDDIEDKIRKLEEKGVVIIDPRQTYISPEVDIDRIYKGCVLYPGCRLTGERTLVGTSAQIGTEGPAVIHNSIIGAEAEVSSGFLSDSTLLPRAKAGANVHFRGGTLLEEYATTAHCVGLKQSILMYSVTLGSLINFCDVLISGGCSRKEHTEVGSGFIHFNFTPWGKNGDKATPSLVGNVTDGVFLDQKRIFLGGLSGMVGPASVGFGSMTVAGQVIRHPVADSTMHAETGSNIDKSCSFSGVAFSERRFRQIYEKNTEFLAQLYALKEWYLHIRLRRSKLQGDLELSLVLNGAIETIQSCMRERVSRYNSLAAEWSLAPMNESILEKEGAPVDVSVDWRTDLAYDEWIKGVGEEEREGLHRWLLHLKSGFKNDFPLDFSSEI